MSSISAARWYVYELLDPAGIVFYVGKGSRNRLYQHVTDAKRLVCSRKCNKIREIISSGCEVIHRTYGVGLEVTNGST